MNLSRREFSSVSIGRKGLWLNANRRGTRESVGLPGSGLRYETERRLYGARTRARGLWWLVIGAVTIIAALVAIAR